MTAVFDPAPPDERGLAGVIEWCRRDRDPERAVLAAAAGDPVALAIAERRLRQIDVGSDVDGAIEIVAARRPRHLVDLAAAWPDVRDEAADEKLVVAWRTALRHLAPHDVIDLDAALRGPLCGEAILVARHARPELGPVSWTSFVRRARARPMVQSELRAVDCYGFTDAEIDLSEIDALPRSLWRVLRSSWHRIGAAAEQVAATGLDDLEPLDVAIVWEAATATGNRAALGDPLADAVVGALTSEACPARWWPAVLALATDWIVP